VFLGCEGESEQSYGKLLSEYVRERRNDLCIDVKRLRPTGGNALAIVQESVKLIRQQPSDLTYVTSAVLLDNDTATILRDQHKQAKEVAEANGLMLIWQDPCHEALLLRHLLNCEHLRPKSSDDAKRQLIRHWPGYYKGISTYRLRDRINEQDILRAARVENDLAAFLTNIGFTTETV